MQNLASNKHIITNQNIRYIRYEKINKLKENNASVVNNLKNKKFD